MKKLFLSVVLGFGCQSETVSSPSPVEEPQPQEVEEEELPTSPIPRPNSVLATQAHQASIVQINVDDPLPKIRLKRHVRSDTVLVDRMKDLVDEVGSGSYRPTTELEDWATEAKSKPGIGAGFAPLDAVPEVRAHYEPHLDKLHVQNTDAVKHRPATFQKPTDYGIGQAAAQTAAEAVFDNLKTAGTISNKWSSTVQHAYSVRQSVVFEDENETFEWERLYVFVFRRFHAGFPLLDTKLEIAIGAHESPARTAYIKLADIRVLNLGITEYADIDTDGARTEFLDQALQAVTPHPSSIELGQEFVGYMMNPRNTVQYPYPKFHATFSSTHGELVAHGVGANLSFVEEKGIGYEWKKYFPWDGATPAYTPRPDGAVCIGPSQCQSGKCYLAGSFGGVCGDCAEDADCASGEVCDHPRPSGAGWTPSECKPVATGVGCTEDGLCGSSALHCATLFYAPSFIAVRTCSPCATDVDCSGSSVCSPTLDYETWVANFECIPEDSRALGDLCEDDNECVGSTICAAVSLGSLGDVGVCSECDGDEDCTSPDTCTLPTASIFGTAGGVCE